VPRVLFRGGRLKALITDQWAPPSATSLLPSFGPFSKLIGRYHQDLHSASVHSFTLSSLIFEAGQYFSGDKGWPQVIARNRWFQKKALPVLKSIADESRGASVKPVLFAYSYAALELLRFAKDNGWTTVLDQIDAGSHEESIVREEAEKYPELCGGWQPAPDSYWDNWRKECALADKIVVNSEWSKRALHEEGISQEKIRLVPLVFEASPEQLRFERKYPDKFTSERPLRVLFLGQIILRKGIARLLEAAKMLENEPIEFLLVGKPEFDPGLLKGRKNIKYSGFVPEHNKKAQYYKSADVFLLPTLSDGFALTQLEAQAWKLPILASKRCGEVVKDHENGLVLGEVTKESIEKAVLFCLENPGQLASFAERTANAHPFSIGQLQNELCRLMPDE